MKHRTVKWGVITTGIISRAFARAVDELEHAQIVAVGARQQKDADIFGKKFGIPTCYGSYQAVLDDPKVEAVYIATPHPMHAEWAIKAANAGKHILCEKPLAMNYAEASEVVEAVRRQDVFLMEAFMYRCNPLTHKALEMIREGLIGNVRLIRSSFSFSIPFDPKSRIFNKELGGGGILDVGCYTTSFARLAAGVATGKCFAEPEEVKGVAHIGESGVDEWASAAVKFPGSILGELTCGVSLWAGWYSIVNGEKASLKIFNPWHGTGHHKKGELTLCEFGKKYREKNIKVRADKGEFALEIETAMRHFADRQAPEMSWEDTLGNMKMLDQWRASIGLEYSMDMKNREEPHALE